ncbi:flagellar motor switch phosphatase FliY [Acetobacterium sp.]|uniref:flagellar motor switch phosphatase FliY n=1 Tax=Acetobacterium sp. TaxID=1872094 RepID=UPI002F3EE61B
MTSKEKNDLLTEMDIDVIGEVMNISMGTAATAMSTILNTKVNITTPRIETIEVKDFEFTHLEPVVGVLIKYIEGIDGSNVLLLKEADMKKILAQLFDMETSDAVEFDEISRSAIGEIMNQMMGAAAGALASFLGKIVNISPPEILDVTNKNNIRELFSLKGDTLVSIKFNLSIDGLVESEFISAMDPLLVKEIVKMSMGVMGIDGEEETEAQEEESLPIEPEEPAFEESQNQVRAEPKRSSQSESVVKSEPRSDQGPTEKMIAKKKQVQVSSYNYKELGEEPNIIKSVSNNLDLIMSVPIQITVELGKTQKKIKDIAELTLGNIIELDKQAGDQVDVIANGRLIARGDVVVVDDNYCVKITEIIKVKEELSLRRSS